MTRSATSGSPVRYIPGILGAVLITGGAAVIYWPAALLVAGVLLLLLDSRIR